MNDAEVRLLSGQKRAPRATIYAFAHAGGSRFTYAQWERLLPDDVAVTRGEMPVLPLNTITKPSNVVLASLISPAANVLQQLELSSLYSTGYILYGHSFGAIFAFEMARQLRRIGCVSPIGLVVSGRRAPQVRLNVPPLSGLSGGKLLGALAALSGEAILEPNVNEWMQARLGSIRAELHLSDNYYYEPEPPFNFPILAARGSGDKGVDPVVMRGWEAETTGHFRQIDVSGGHFFDEIGTSRLLTELHYLARTGRLHPGGAATSSSAIEPRGLGHVEHP